MALVILEGLVIVLLVILVAGLLRSHGEILRRLEAIGAGEEMEVPLRRRPASGTDAVPVESLSGTTPRGAAATVSLSGSRGFALLAFLSAGCSSCHVFWTAFGAGVELPRADIRPVIVTRGAESESPAEIAALAPSGLLTLMSDQMWDAFGVPGTPYFQLVDTAAGVVVGEGSAGSWPRVVELIRRSLADTDHEPRRIRLSTTARLQDSDEELRQAGIRPGDATLFGRPGEGP